MSTRCEGRFATFSVSLENEQKQLKETIPALETELEATTDKVAALQHFIEGCILQGAAVIGYLLAEGLTDAEGVKSAGSAAVQRGGGASHSFLLLSLRYEDISKGLISEGRFATFSVSLENEQKQLKETSRFFLGVNPP